MPDDINNLQNDISRLSIRKSDTAKEQEILRSLSFDSRPIRFTSISAAHDQTFRWLFDSHENNATACHLAEWLKRDNGFFWVSGKPGSGKSTFMKYLSNCPETSYALAEWARPMPVVTAAHYFWSAGTPMQRSQQGLLQTLLYDIFRQVPSLVKIACKGRWEQMDSELESSPWSLEELNETVKTIADQVFISVRFCIFIDGLDEFEGDQLDLCQALLSLSRSPNIKLCVSSRPWNVFEDSFGKKIASKIYIHELTRNDIRNYASSRLQQHPKWHEVCVQPEQAIWLIDQITERASGVFLWVFLVTKQLRNGITEYDSFSDLRRRLESIPTDLEAFFKDILSSVEKIYHGKMATTLQMSLAATQPLSTIVYSFHDDEYDDEEYALRPSFRPLGDEVFKMRNVQITRRLNGRCKGLLEVNDSGCVEFLHRTVMDFLRTRAMYDFLIEKSPKWFNADFSILKALTAYLKCWAIKSDSTRISSDQLENSIEMALQKVSLLDDPSDGFAYLDELDRCLLEIEKDQLYQRFRVGETDLSPSIYFRTRIIETALSEYILHTLPLRPDYFSGFETPPLYTLVSVLVATEYRREQHLDILKCLLEHGQGPNERTGNVSDGKGSAWQLLVHEFNGEFGEFAEWIISKNIIRLMVQHNADPNAYINLPISYTVAWLKVFKFAFQISPNSPSQIPYLQAIDDLIRAGADISALVGSGKQYPAAHSFLVDLALHLRIPTAKVNWPLLTDITEKVLLMARKARLEIPESSFSNLKKYFPKEAFDRLESQYWRPGDGSGEKNGKARKRKRKGSNDRRMVRPNNGRE